MEHSTLTLEQTNPVHQSDRISQAVVEAVSEAEGVDQTELTPLFTAIDPDALESLFHPQIGNGTSPVSGEVRFSYHGYEVRVSADGEVALAEDLER